MGRTYTGAGGKCEEEGAAEQKHGLSTALHSPSHLHCLRREGRGLGMKSEGEPGKRGGRRGFNLSLIVTIQIYFLLQ